MRIDQGNILKCLLHFCMWIDNGGDTPEHSTAGQNDLSNHFLRVNWFSLSFVVPSPSGKKEHLVPKFFSVFLPTWRRCPTVLSHPPLQGLLVVNGTSLWQLVKKYTSGARCLTLSYSVTPPPSQQVPKVHTWSGACWKGLWAHITNF